MCVLGSEATLVSHWMDDKNNTSVIKVRASKGTLNRRSAFAVVSTDQPALGPFGGLWPIVYV
jgi:hypothetical protein